MAIENIKKWIEKIEQKLDDVGLEEFEAYVVCAVLKKRYEDIIIEAVFPDYEEEGDSDDFIVDEFDQEEEEPEPEMPAQKVDHKQGIKSVLKKPMAGVKKKKIDEGDF